MLFKNAKILLYTGVTFLFLCSGVRASLRVSAQSSPSKSKADFVCDGVDDQKEIQKAIDTLPSSGGVVELLEGMFNFTDDVEITKSNVTIKGAGKSTILKHKPTKWIKLTKDEEKGSKKITVKDTSQFHPGHLIAVTDSNISCPPEGAQSYYYTYYIPSKFHTIKNINGKTITLDRGLETDVLVERGAKVTPVWVMIKAYGKTNLELRDFSIDCNRDNVTRPYHSYVSFPASQLRTGLPHNYVSPPETIIDKIHHGEEPTSAIYMDYAHNSKFKNLYLHDIPMSGIFLIDSDYILVEGNTIRDYGLKGYVDCFGKYTQIIGNIVENSRNEDGIIIYHSDSDYAVISNNIVRNCRRGCILINGAGRVLVTGNNVYGGGNGIFVCTQQSATVTGNYIEACAYGVSVWPTSAGVGDYPVTITGNSIRDCRTAFGIRKVRNLSLVGNVVSGVQERGAAVASAGTDSGNKFIIANNQFLNGSAEGPAIHLGGDDHLISGNKIKGFKKGVWLEGTAEENVIERNEFIDVPEPIFDEGKENIKENNS